MYTRARYNHIKVCFKRKVGFSLSRAASPIIDTITATTMPLNMPNTCTPAGGQCSASSMALKTLRSVGEIEDSPRTA